MNKTVKIDCGSFNSVYTPYQFATYYASKVCIKDAPTLAKLERNDGEWILFLHFPREAHAFTLNDIAEELNCHYVLVGTLSDKTNVICVID